MDVFLGILLFLLGGCAGAAIVLKVLEKSMDDLMEAYDDLVRTQQNIMHLDNKIIAGKDKIIHDTYVYLVRLRDQDEGNLDDIIGELGEILDDSAEEDADDESDSD